jgi:hypothetical protein
MQNANATYQFTQRIGTSDFSESNSGPHAAIPAINDSFEAGISIGSSLHSRCQPEPGRPGSLPASSRGFLASSYAPMNKRKRPRETSYRSSATDLTVRVAVAGSSGLMMYASSNVLPGKTSLAQQGTASAPHFG